jgi:TonB family protein
MYGSRWGTSGAVCATGSGRILLSAPPASSFQTVRFSIGAFTGRSAEQEQWRRLLWALAGSLLLHWGVWAVLRPGAGAVGPGLGRSTVFATLRSTARAAPPAAIEAPGDEILAASADAPSTRVAESEPALPPEPAESADATSLLATLGQQRLEAQLPPYLVAPLAIGASLGPWYFPRSELTVAPKLLDEPLIPQPEKPGTTGPRTGKVVLRVFVGAGGTVDRVEVAGSSLSADFDAAAAAAFARLRFSPGEIEGVAVNSETRFEIVFDGGETDGSHATDRVSVGDLRPIRPVGR